MSTLPNSSKPVFVPAGRYEWKKHFDDMFDDEYVWYSEEKSSRAAASSFSGGLGVAAIPPPRNSHVPGRRTRGRLPRRCDSGCRLAFADGAFVALAGVLSLVMARRGCFTFRERDDDFAVGGAQFDLGAHMHSAFGRQGGSAFGAAAFGRHQGGRRPPGPGEPGYEGDFDMPGGFSGKPHATYPGAPVFNAMGAAMPPNYPASMSGGAAMPPPAFAAAMPGGAAMPAFGAMPPGAPPVVSAMPPAFNAAMPGAQPPPPTVADELKKLSDLHAAGAISAEEFAAAKLKMLGM